MTAGRTTPTPREVADGVFFVQGPASNWIVLRDGREFTLLDSGYTRDTAAVLASVRTLGLDPAQAAAVVLTHAHVDHTGGARHLSVEYGVPVLAAAQERAAVRGEEQFQVALPQLVPLLWRPRVLAWTARAVRAGGLTPNAITTDGEASSTRLADLPGRPQPVPTPGHTPGHTAYRLAGDALATGDALITAHALNGGGSPHVQPIHAVFDHDRPAADAARRSLAELGQVTVLPGHGPAMGADPARL
ncbi:MBL fold metallo-hydrolase [Tersicoccus sp. MR15.9]|uniref:MBL fold metallo-hydrolase n=1 Tax=Tersicoccus mangrovi TaxID=3121635 RepID=UPI002FE66D46